MSRLKAIYTDFYSHKDFRHFPQEASYISFLISWLPHSQARVLDVGCGTGFHCALFADRGAIICGIDLSIVGLRIARNKAPKADLCLANATSLPFRAETFDMIFCQGLSIFNIHPEPSASYLARDMIRCLKPGGTFVFAWSSNLRGGKRKRNWHEHRLSDVVGFFGGLELDHVYFLERRFVLRVLGRHAFSGFLSRLAGLGAWVTGFPVLMVCLWRKPSPRFSPSSYSPLKQS